MADLEPESCDLVQGAWRMIEGVDHHSRFWCFLSREATNNDTLPRASVVFEETVLDNILQHTVNVMNHFAASRQSCQAIGVAVTSFT